MRYYVKCQYENIGRQRKLFTTGVQFSTNSTTSSGTTSILSIFVHSAEFRTTPRAKMKNTVGKPPGACLKTIKSQFSHESKSSFSNYADDLKQFKRVLGKLTGAIKMSAGVNRRIILRFREGLKNPTLS